MKFFVLLVVLVAVEIVVDARSLTLSSEEGSQGAKRVKKQIEYEGANYPGLETSIAHSSSSVHSHSTVHRHHLLPHLLHHSVSYSKTHSFNANLQLPHSSLSVEHSKTHQHQHIMG
nr:PREDICTED: uncharacterized protein LOC105663711 [Megachile rotundata]